MPYTFPPGFLWGTATAAHQIEGGNWNSDWWAFEHAPATPCVEPSGDAADSLFRWQEDVDLVASLGLGAYRFSIEWARIEPEEGEWSRAALDHYRRICAACHDAGLLPVVTLHHFTTPRWAAQLGGWEDPGTVDRFARYCERAIAHLGDLVGMACTINEPNIVSLMGYLVGAFPPGRNDLDAYARANDVLIAAHRRAYDAIHAGPGDFPVGLTVAMGDWWAPPGSEDALARTRHLHEGQFLEAARGDDFIGVQAYSRTRLDASGMPTGPEEGVPVVTSMGYERWPQSVEVAVRFAATTAGVPVYVTESGIGTDDDADRVEYLTDAIAGVGRCIDDGIDVRGYFHWSLLDNFEWALGYAPRFGMVAVDRDTHTRTPKPSATWFAGVAARNGLL